MTVKKHQPSSYDVAVIGAGIVGCYAASALAQMGYNVCILEKNAQAGSKPVCTGLISRDCLDLIPEAGQVTQYELSSARVFSPSGMCIRLARETTQAFVIDRPSLDRHMASHAQKKGAVILFSTRAASLTNCDKSIRIEAISKSGTSAIEARAALITCGAGTALAKLTGLSQIRSYAHGAQTELHVSNLPEVEIYSGNDIAPGFFAWLVPAGGKTAKVGMLCRTNPTLCMGAFLDRLKREGRIGTEQHPIHYGAVPLRPLTRTYGDHILVAGDAAGQVKPTTGGGIYFGLLCANLAVQTIDEALKRGDTSERYLSLYQKRWHRILKQELSIGYWAHRFYSSLDDTQIEHIFGAIERHDIHETILASPDITFDWHGKVILDALKHRSLQRSLEKLGLGSSLQWGKRM